MNERIRELAERLDPIATIGNWGRVEWADNVYPQLGDKMYAAVDLQKFAELIVRECSKVIRHGGQRKGAFGNEDLRPSEIATMIEEHFGVEELQQTIDFETQDPETAKGTKVEQFGVEE